MTEKDELRTYHKTITTQLQSECTHKMIHPIWLFNMFNNYPYTYITQSI